MAEIKNSYALRELVKTLAANYPQFYDEYEISRKEWEEMEKDKEVGKDKEMGKDKDKPADLMDLFGFMRRHQKRLPIHEIRVKSRISGAKSLR